MGALLEEYGEAIVACVIAAILLPFMLYSIQNFYKEKYPTYNDKSMETVNQSIIANSGSPELIASETFRIRKGDTSYDTRSYMLANNISSEGYKNALNNYKSLAKAYETGTGSQTNKDQEISVDVYGTENIDVNNFGEVYNILFKATNKHGHTTTKQMKIIIG